MLGYLSLRYQKKEDVSPVLRFGQRGNQIRTPILGNVFGGFKPTRPHFPEALDHHRAERKCICAKLLHLVHTRQFPSYGLYMMCSSTNWAPYQMVGIGEWGSGKDLWVFGFSVLFRGFPSKWVVLSGKVNCWILFGMNIGFAALRSALKDLKYGVW